ncbi:nonsense-mediated mRNA decay factor SMG9 isoform X1 [Hydra vulgaris]|nr:nonsense-mediated mRNA decay factor SMG9 isoform X2 [Hydra vulgaris]
MEADYEDDYKGARVDNRRGERGRGGTGRKDRKPRERIRRERDTRIFKDRQENIENPLVLSNQKMPIILAKKGAEVQATKDTTVLTIQRRDESHTSGVKNLSNDMNSSLLYQKHTTSRTDRTPDLLSPATPIQPPPPVTYVDHNISIGLAALNLPVEINATESVNLIDNSFQWSDRAIEMLLDQNDFVVVGCVGLQGSGKSTLLSMLTGQQIVQKSRLVFRPQKATDLEKCIHRTVGVDIFVTQERLILLDTQPLLSPSMLDQYLRFDRKVPAEYATAEICLEVQALQLLTFLFTVCHVVLVVQDYIIDFNLLNLLKTAEMLKPSTVSHSNQDGSSSGSEEVNEFIPNIVFVQTCCDERSFEVEVVKSLCEILSTVFQTSNLRTRGCASIIRSPLMSYMHSKQLFPYQDFNLFLLPEFALSQEETDVIPLSKYRGHPNINTLIKVFRQQLLSIPREMFTHHLLSERNWFHYAARTWEAVKKSNLISEYHRLLSS